MRAPASLSVQFAVLIATTSCRGTGLGALARLSDELLLAVLGLLDAHGLTIASVASRAMLAFCTHEELWKALTLEAVRRTGSTGHVHAPH